MQPPSQDAKPEDIDVAALGRALWRAKTWIVSLSILVGATDQAVAADMPIS